MILLHSLIQAKHHRSRKLLLLYLLRSSSALATSNLSSGSSSASSATYSSTSLKFHPGDYSSTSSDNSSQDLLGHIELRVATRSDISAIQRCNLATLPENYSSNFYMNHLRQWPDLALVAEHVKPSSMRSRNSFKRNPLEMYDPSQSSPNEIVGYVLGKVEETAVLPSLPPSRVLDEDRTTGTTTTSAAENTRLGQGFFTAPFSNYPSPPPPPPSIRNTERMGHVTSLAVLSNYRRKGLAAKLMKQLHFHMQEGYDADAVGLHVRVSNIAARRLYCEGMGYGVVDVIRGYYQDGEDAFYMRKRFVKSDRRGRWNGSSNVGQGIHRSVWENAPQEFRLPIIIPLSREYNHDERRFEVDDSSPGQDYRVISGGF